MRREDGGENPWYAVAAVVLTLLVVGGTAIAWRQFNSTADEAFQDAVRPTASASSSTPGPSTTTSAPADAEGSDDAEATSEPPTFTPLKATKGRDAPVVLLVGDGYAASAGASSVGDGYPSLLSRDLAWEVKLSVSPGAGYTVRGESGRTLPMLYAAAAPVQLSPDLVLVQGGFAGPAAVPSVADAIEAFGARVRDDLSGVPVVVVTPFTPGATTGLAEKRERTIARAWRAAVPDVLLMRPQEEGWAALSTGDGGLPDDEGHALIASSILADLSAAGLVTPASPEPTPTESPTP